MTQTLFKNQARPASELNFSAQALNALAQNGVAADPNFSSNGGGILKLDGQPYANFYLNEPGSANAGFVTQVAGSDIYFCGAGTDLYWNTATPYFVIANASVPGFKAALIIVDDVIYFAIPGAGGDHATAQFIVDPINGITIADACNVAVGTSSGTKIGTSPSQKIGFFDATPIAQPAGNGNNANTVSPGSTTTAYTNTTYDGGIGGTAYTIGDLVYSLKQLGLIAP